MIEKTAATHGNLEKPPLLSQMIFELVRERIIEGRLKPGERVNELALQKELGTSRAPIREALGRLGIEGLVESLPRRGVFVRRISAEDLHEAVVVRAKLESLAAGLAAELIDKSQFNDLMSLLEEMDHVLEARDVARYTKVHETFHEAIAQASRNKTLVKHIRLASQPFATLSLTYLYLIQLKRYERAGHRALMQAIVDRDGKLAANLAEEHVLTMLELPPETMEAE